MVGSRRFSKEEPLGELSEALLFVITCNTPLWGEYYTLGGVNTIPLAGGILSPFRMEYYLPLGGILCRWGWNTISLVGGILYRFVELWVNSLTP